MDRIIAVYILVYTILERQRRPKIINCFIFENVRYNTAGMKSGFRGDV